MNMQLWNPFEEFENLLDRYNKSGGKNLGKQYNTDLSFADWAPSVDIEEVDDKYVIKADLPGVDKKDIDVKLENGVLIIRGEKQTADQRESEYKHSRSTLDFFGISISGKTYGASSSND